MWSSTPGAYSHPVRIASLVPSATEILFALGLGDQVVAVTHECDHPEAAKHLPRLTASVIPDDLPPAEIDARVREVTGRGEALYTLDEEALEPLEPDLIVTQALCAVCAVSYDDVRAVAERLPSRPEVISLDPESLDQVLGDIGRVAEAAGDPGLAAPLRTRLEARIESVREAVAGAARPRVLALEWLDPPFIGGHWVPEMIELGGGTDALGVAGVKSRTGGWDEFAAAEPDVAVVMPCGLYADEAAEQASAHREQLAALGAARIVAVDAASSFSRPGPRLVNGIELLGHLLHPELVAVPAGLEWREVAVANVPQTPL
jgi:iron complex transport system substrate-binding protein